MPAFKGFGSGDQVDGVMVLHPEYTLVSGSDGWRGSPEGSASLSLYGGARRRPGIFSAIEYQSFAPNVGQTGHPRRGFPLTASVEMAMVRNETLNLAQDIPTRRGERHWSVLQRLYHDYRSYNTEYTTSSYDYYCLYFRGSSTNRATIEASGLVTGSFTLESWVKPITTSSLTQPVFAIQSLADGGRGAGDGFVFGIDGTSGRLMLSSSLVRVTASEGPPVRRWSHVACVYDSSAASVTFFVDLRNVGTVTSPAFNYVQTSTYSIGSVSDGNSPGAGISGTSFDGLIGESRLWPSALSHAELSGRWNRQLSGSELHVPLSYFSPREGPLLSSIFSLPGSPTPVTLGSASQDLSGLARGVLSMFSLRGFDDRVGPVWHPSDNIRLLSPRRLLGSDFLVSLSGSALMFTGSFEPVTRVLMVDIPSAFYGRQIVPHSVRLTCRAYEQFGLIRTLIDDGRGALFISGSICSSSLEAREDYRGVGWNKVGNVFYGEGLIVIRDPSLLDFGRDDGAFLDRASTLSLTFRGDSRIPTKTLMCRIDHGEFNCSSNPTFFVTGSAGERLRRHVSGSIRATTVGLYNSDRELVGVARLADPIRIRPRDRINIKVRMDF